MLSKDLIGGEYPDHSKFSPDDLRAPDVIYQALDQLGLDKAKGFQTQIQAGLTVEGIIPTDVVRQRDHLRVVGQTPPPYIPDEYSVSLTLPYRYPLTSRERERLVNAIVSVYRDKFERTYGNLPLAFGNVFDTLKGADLFQYEEVLNWEFGKIMNFLDSKIAEAKAYRSPTTNLSFDDLSQQAKLFHQVRLNETLGQIMANGLTRNRSLAILTMKYYLQTLKDDERRAAAEEQVVQALLAKAQDRSQGYVLGIKSQAAQEKPVSPVLDQGLIDSLLENDSYSFLVHQALAAGVKVKDIQSDESQVLERLKTLELYAAMDTTAPSRRWLPKSKSRLWTYRLDTIG